MQSFRTHEEVETFLLDQGENIVDLMGGEIDRIEMNLRVSTLLKSYYQTFNNIYLIFFRQNSRKFVTSILKFFDIPLASWCIVIDELRMCSKT